MAGHGWRGKLNAALERFGYRITNLGATQRDMFDDRRFVEIHRRTAPLTMTSPERLYALYQSVLYVVDNGIPGHVAECGVWRGGSCVAVAMTLAEVGDPERRIYLYDLFGGASVEGATYWSPVGLEAVRANLAGSGLPADRFACIAGDVRETVRSNPPPGLALLRLDVDTYEPTRAALRALYPRVAPGGVVIVDDYGSHPEGARRATDEFLGEHDLRPFLHRVDGAARLWIKPAAGAGRARSRGPGDGPEAE